MADAPHRSAEQLIAALAAGEIDLREFLVEARPLRGDDVTLPGAVRAALFDRLPTVPAIIGRDGPLATLCEMFTITQLISGIMFTIVVLDEQVILFNCINGHLGAFAYSRYAVEDALQTGEVLLPISTGSIMMTAEDDHIEEKILTYVQRYFETDEDGSWRCPWLPLLDGRFDANRAAEQVVSFSKALSETSPQVEAFSDELAERMANGTVPQALTAFRAKMLAHLYVPARYACSPPGAIRRRRNWARRKQLVLLKALEAKGRSTTTTALARFLCRLCPEPQFRDIVGRF